MDNVDNNGEWKFGVVDIDAYYAFANPWYPNGVHHINSSGELSATYSDLLSVLYGVVRRQQYVQ